MKKLIFFLSFVSYTSFGQFNDVAGIWGANNVQKGDELYTANFYEEAIVYYKMEIEKNTFSDDVLFKLAECYRKISDYKNERSYYTIIAQTSGFEEPTDKLYFAESLMTGGDNDEAIKWFENYLVDNPNDEVAQRRLEGARNMDKFYEDSASIVVNHASFNTSHTEFGAVPYKNGIVFSSSREKDLIIQHDNLRQIESLLDLYYLPLTSSNDEEIEPERIKLKNHWKSNDGPITIGKNLVVINRNMGKNKSEIYNALGLQFYSYDGDELTHSYSFPYNDHSYSISHPSFNETQDTLYFASDMPGGFGGKDIFYSVFDGNEWSRPFNIGSSVNTRADEVFPFYTNGELYFSSNGHEGIGGLDIYVQKKVDGITEVQNMGYPMNSGWDDFSIFIKGNKGYFSSNRPGGFGHDDIYEVEVFEKEEKVVVMANLKIRISDFLNDKPIELAEITLFDKEEEFETKFFASAEGEFNREFNPSNYTLKISKPGYEPIEMDLDMVTRTLLVEDIYMNPTLAMERLSIDSILFEYNDFRLTEEAKIEIDHIMEVMTDYPTIRLEVGAHTDSRGEDDYNHWLSEMRAASTANYLIELGLIPTRIDFVGYGENELLNHCANEVPCTEKEHAINRRLEFQFILQDQEKD